MKLITANNLTNGYVIYWTEARSWSRSIDDAARLDDTNAETELALALKDESTEIVAPYLIEAENGRPSGRERLKETIRLAGPTVGSSKLYGAKKAG